MVIARVTLWVEGTRIRVIGERGSERLGGLTSEIPHDRIQLAGVLCSIFEHIGSPRASAVVVIGYPHAHVREVATLPLNAQLRDVRAALALGKERFLRRRVGGLTVLGVWRGRGAWIVAECDTELLDAIVSAASSAGIEVRAVITEQALRARDVGNGRAESVARNARIEMEVRAGTPVSIRTQFIQGEAKEDSVRHVDERRARRVDGVFDPRAGSRTKRLRRRLLLLSVVASLAAIALGGFAPGLVANSAAKRAEDTLRSVDSMFSYSADSVKRLQEYITHARAVATFERIGYATRVDIGGIARALPEGSAILSLSVDSAALRLVVLTPRGAGLLAGLVLDSNWAQATLVGPIVREQANGVAFERVAIEMRSRWDADAPDR